MARYGDFLIRLALLGTAVVAALALLGQLDLPGLAWPLELFTHFSLHIAIVGLVLAGVGAFRLPRLALGSAVIVAMASMPVIALGKFERPNGSGCQPEACLTVMTANVWTRRDALTTLAERVAVRQPDVLGLNEVPSDLREAELAALFPGYQTVALVSPETMGRPMGRHLALLSREPVKSLERILPEDTAGRGLIKAQLDFKGETVTIIALHPLVPLTPEGRRARNALFEHVSAVSNETENLIVMGDLNITPWARDFRLLPGHRAGDPRLTYTHDVRKPLFGLPIDHILFDGNLELRAAQQLDRFGSDHRPVLARFDLAPGRGR